MGKLDMTPAILVVDDDRVFTLSVQRTLKSMRMDSATQVACDGLEALKILQNAGHTGKHRIENTIILLDLNMPRMNGWEFLTKIGSDKTLKPAAVYVFTDAHSVDELDQFHGDQIAGYIDKDYAKEMLTNALSGFRQPGAEVASRLN